MSENGHCEGNEIRGKRGGPEGIPRDMATERLQKIMAAAGVASRRKAEEFIAAGRVTLNGEVVREQGTKADPERDEICVDGKPLEKTQELLYFLLNKPKGYVTTASDPEGRPTVMDLMGAQPARVFPVGRLDYASEGLLLVTNDGALAQTLTKAGSHVPKTYLVKVNGTLEEKAIEKLRNGVCIPLEDGRRAKTSPAKISLAEAGKNPWYEVELIEGRNRQIRKMFQQVGYLVEKIKRVRLGPLELDVPPGKYRALTKREVDALKTAAARENCRAGSSGRKMKLLLPDGAPPSSDPIRDILTKYKTIAVAGLSADRFRTSNNISEYMKEQGYRIIPVNPNETEVFGEKSYPRVEDVPEKVEIVNIFRRPEDVPPVVEGAIKAGAKVVWMQLGIENEEAGEMARKAGLTVVMDACIYVEHKKRGL